VVLVVLLVAPTPVAERYTSPTLDGQFIVHPVRSYGFIFSLMAKSGSATLGSPGEALAEAKSAFADSGSRPVKVALLYLSGRVSYSYVTKAGTTLTIDIPPSLVWEVWGRPAQSSSDQTDVTDVIGFLDYSSGERIGMGALLGTTETVP
jgi:hypothetical protein